MSDDPERCPYCGALVETPCDEPPPDTCEKALASLLPRLQASLLADVKRLRERCI